MSEESWSGAWRAWLRARFGADLGEARREAIVADAERMRVMGEVVRAQPLDNGELPFSHLLPPDGDGS